MRSREGRPTGGYAADRALGTRRDVIGGSLRLAGGGALALLVAASPGFGHRALAQDETPEAGTDDTTVTTEGEAGTEVTVGDTAPAAGAEQAAAATAGQGDGEGGQATALPSTGSGHAAGGRGPEMIGLAAAGAAAAFVARRALRSGPEASG